MIFNPNDFKQRDNDGTGYMPFSGMRDVQFVNPNTHILKRYYKEPKYRESYWRCRHRDEFTIVLEEPWYPRTLTYLVY